MNTLTRFCVSVVFSLLIVSGLVAVKDVKAKDAATISYKFVPALDGLPAEFAVPSNAKLKFLEIQAIDGFQVDTALFEQKPANPANTTF